MREKKFKLWDKFNERFVLYFILDSDGDIKIGKLSDDEEPFIENISNYEICQFTGFYDKNGKELYEDDIVISYDKKIIISDINEFAYFMIEFNCRDTSTFRLVGNIYENPELLK